MIGGWLNPADNRNSDVLTTSLPEPFEVVYSDTVSTRPPSIVGADIFGDAEVEASAEGTFPVRFHITMRLNKLYDNILVDRLE